MVSIRKKMLLALLSLMHQTYAYKIESKEMVPGVIKSKYFQAAETYKPFGTGLIDYVLVKPTDMMDRISEIVSSGPESVQVNTRGVQVNTYVFIQLAPDEKEQILLTLDKSSLNTPITPLFIAETSKSNDLMGKVLQDFYTADNSVTVGKIIAVLRKAQEWPTVVE